MSDVFLVPASGDTLSLGREGKNLILRDVTETLPTAGQVLTWDAVNKKWIPGSIVAGVSSFNARTGAVMPATGDYTAAQVGADPAGSAAAAQAAAIAASDPVGSAATVQGNLNTHAGLTTTAHGGIVASTDPRLTDARTPTAHKTTHEPGGTDAMTVDAAAAIGSLRTLGTASTSACAGDDSRLSNSRTPTAHAASHAPAAGDTIFPENAVGQLSNDGAGVLSWTTNPDPGAVSINPGTTARNTIQPTGATIIPLTVKGFSAQSVNLQEWQTSSGTPHAAINALGEYVFTRGSGVGNFAAGAGAGGTLTTGSYNTCIGNDAGMQLTTAGGNVMIGHRAGGGAVDGTTDAVFIGTGAGYAGGSVYNVAIGTGALSGNTGGQNIAIGYAALAATSTGAGCVVIGYAADMTGTGMAMTAVGWESMIFATTAYNCTAIGNAAGYSITEGYENVMVGQASGAGLTTGYQNTFVGTCSGLTNSTQRSGSIAIGYGATVNQDYSCALGRTGATSVLVGINSDAPGAHLHINCKADNVIGQITRRYSATQSANLAEWQDSSATVLASIASNGRVISAGGVKIKTQSELYSYGLMVENPSNDSGVWIHPDGTGNGVIEQAYTSTGSYKDLIFSTSNTERVRIGSTGAVQITNGGAGVVPFTVKGYAAQSADLFQAQNSSAAVVASLSSGGGLFKLDPASGDATLRLKAGTGYHQITHVAADGTCSFVYDTGTGGGTVWIIDANGKTGFNVTPAAQVHAQSYQSNVITMVAQGYSGQTANLQEWRDSAAAVRASINPNGGFLNTQAAVNGGAGSSRYVARMTGGAHTGLDGGVECTDVFINLNRTIQFNSGALSNQRSFRIDTPTLAFTGTTTVTDADGVVISGPPSGGTNATLTESCGLVIESKAIANTTSGYSFKSTSPTGATNNVAALVKAGAATGIPLQVQGATSQSANLAEFRDSSGTVLSYVNSNGELRGKAAYWEREIALGDETTDATTGTAKVTFRMPFAVTLTEVRGSLSTAATGANLFTIDINEAGTSILSTKITLDASERTSTTAATAPVISDTGLADDAEITVDIDQVGNTTAGKGPKVTLIGYRP